MIYSKPFPSGGWLSSVISVSKTREHVAGKKIRDS